MAKSTMYSRLWPLLFVAALLLATSTAIASDEVYAMMHHTHRTLLFTKIIDRAADKITLRVIKSLRGNTKTDVLITASPFQYKGTSQRPKADDYCFVSLTGSGPLFKVDPYAIKSDSGDFRTATLINESEFPDMPDIQWFVNSGGRDTEFSHVNGGIFVKPKDGAKLEIARFNPLQELRNRARSAVLARITGSGAGGSSTTFNVLRVLAGHATLGAAEMAGHLAYAGSSSEPLPNDLAFIVMDEDSFHLVFYSSKVDSDDFRNLKILDDERYPNRFAIERFIHSGGSDLSQPGEPITFITRYALTISP